MFDNYVDKINQFFILELYHSSANLSICRHFIRNGVQEILEVHMLFPLMLHTSDNEIDTCDKNGQSVWVYQSFCPTINLHPV